MAKCICPDDYRQIPKAKRMTTMLHPPKRVGSQMEVNMDNVLISHADCPLHGYEVLSDDGDVPATTGE